MNSLRQELTSLLNRKSAENGSNTPDFILAEFMLASLAAFEVATKARDKWYGAELTPGHCQLVDPDGPTWEAPPALSDEVAP